MHHIAPLLLALLTPDDELPPPAPEVTAPAVEPAAPEPTGAATPAPPDPAVTAPAPVVTAPPSWRVGAGLGGATFIGGGVVVVGVLPAARVPVPTPALAISAERRLTSSLWLIGDASASVAQSNGAQEPPEGPGTAVTKSTDLFTSASVAVGVRWALVDAFVEPSVYALLGGAIAYSQSHADVQVSDGTNIEKSANESLGTGYGGGIVAGMALEMPLVDALSVRVASDLVGASIATGYSQQRIADGPRQDADATTVTAGLELNPSIQLRLAF